MRGQIEDKEAPPPQVEYLQYVWLVARKHKRMMLAIGLVTFVTVQFFGYLVTPVWEGTTMLLVERTSRQNLSVFREVSIPVAGSDKAGDAAVELIPLLTGWNMAYDAVRQFQLDQQMREKRYNPPTLRDLFKGWIVDVVYSPLYLIRGWEEANWTDKAAEEFIEDWIDIEEEEDSMGVINLTVYGESPQQAMDIANAMAALLEQRTQEYSRSGAAAAHQFVSAQLKLAEANQNQAEVEVARFQEANQLYAVDDSRRLLVQKQDKLRADLIETRRLQEEVNSSRADDARSQGRQFLQANIELSPVIRQIEATLVNLSAKRSAMLLEKTPDHPDLKALEAEVERNQQQLQDALAVENTTLDVRAREIEKSLETVDSQIQRMPEKEMALARLLQALTIGRSVVEALKSRAEHLAVERQSVANEYTIRVIDRAFVPPSRDQDWPLWWLNVLVGLFLGVGFAVAAAYLLEYWNEPVLSARDVQSGLGLRFLGRFSELSGRDS